MVKKAEEGEEGSIEWFLAKDGGTDEQKALKRKAWTMMQTGEYHEALDILWKNFPDEYPIPECEQKYYHEEVFGEPYQEPEKEPEKKS
ncbi:MAG: hypothetical protein PUC99_07445 [Eubacteriales bacterium]|jgi:hypothetical protein|nr:hypothetical protein [Lachnospiraceae bacterium]MDD5860153.1 hypothetical protein [Eubacteriales bacterium]MCH4064225.1 hypothetical protein [Lachnospiraceae bacterium]MCH4103050.1 hypothetical protein [Lachnospiraceae bacterium]MCI1308805.1 hypothetical protein [Lachnospiraceae bacterium]